MVHDNVHVNADANAITALNHIGEFLAVATAGGELIGLRLVALVPRACGNDDIFLHGRHLDASKTIRGEEVFAFARDVGPFPLEEVNDSGSVGRKVRIVIAK